MLIQRRQKLILTRMKRKRKKLLRRSRQRSKLRMISVPKSLHMRSSSLETVINMAEQTRIPVLIVPDLLPM